MSDLSSPTLSDNRHHFLNAPKTNLSSHPKTVYEKLKEELMAGVEASKDPINAGLPKHFPRITTIYSPWYTRTCPVCGLKFRENDRVRLCPKCDRAYHDDDQFNLHCWHTHFANGNECTTGGNSHFYNKDHPGCSYKWPDKADVHAPSQQTDLISSVRIEQVSTQFLKGLQSTWHAFGNKDVIEVKATDKIIGFKCPWCRFSIRVGDRVVKCPCGNCNTYFHNDIFRHLECWNDWNGTQGNDFCPTSGAKIEKNIIKQDL